MFSDKQWNLLTNVDIGFMSTFSESIRQLEVKDSNLLPNIRRGSTILVASDYSGQHNQSCYQSLAFLLADLEACGVWEEQRTVWRPRFLSDNRRMSYKNLNDKKRREALVSFLNVANTIPGIVVTVLVDKKISSLFKKTGYLDMTDLEFQAYKHWNSKTFEKLLRAIHFVSFFIAGLSRSAQNILWITDEDEIVPNKEKLQEAVKIFANISSHYLSHDMGNFQWGTTKSDNGTRQIEDLVSVPDLIAGSLSHILTNYEQREVFPSSHLILPPPEDLPQKVIEIMNWFADSTQPLKRLVYSIRLEKNSTSLTLDNLRFLA